ncbi:uncharacterized protein H6S33_011172 [Morchella sextelata]|uniref:uncharacterized protein n=1 Tax=Morchella sextelata TaxID=1174677 RepID=UPI001D053C37|nr:uncharacterized protein H6S33_011172 [Morchella sextelata]KAH0610745.1 hypothetical protein H6S33_011172 [Morchella sextelata]
MGRTKLPPYPFGETLKACAAYNLSQRPPSPPASPPSRPPASKLPPEFLAPTSTSLLSLPDPLLILISTHLDPKSLSSLTHAHRHLLSLITPQQVPPPPPPLSQLPPLHLAALKGDTTTIITLLTTTSTDANSRASLFNGKTPLYYAVLAGHSPAVRALLDNGAAINTPSEITYGKTALHLAVSGGNAPLVRLLLKRGADASIEDYKGRTPILWASRSAPRGRELVEVFRALLAAGASVNSCDLEYGASVLHWAVVKGRKETVEWLLERGASVVAPTFYELRTPVGWALEWGDGEMVGLLKRWVYQRERKGRKSINIGGWIKRLRA